MKMMTKIVTILGGALASLVLFVGTNSVNSPCVLFLHQPIVPEKMNKFKKQF